MNKMKLGLLVVAIVLLGGSVAAAFVARNQTIQTSTPTSAAAHCPNHASGMAQPAGTIAPPSGAEAPSGCCSTESQHSAGCATGDAESASGSNAPAPAACPMHAKWDGDPAYSQYK